MFQKLASYYKSQQFNPSLLGLFINPFFFIRLGLHRAIKRNANLLNGKMLDFGCGNKPYKNLFKVEKHIGIDVEQSGHSHKNEDVDVFFDGNKIPFEDNYFDSCFCSEVFEHIFEIENSLKEISRVLKPESLCIITVPFVWNEHEIPFDYARYSSFGIIYLLEKHGFEIVKKEKVSHFFETVFQLWNLYLYSLLSGKNKFWNLLTTLLFIAPFNIVGLLLTNIAPRNYSLYTNNVIVARKKTSA